MSGPIVGVLLPLRLETRFTPPADGNGWRLKVRIVPDAANLDRHQPQPTAAELDAVESLWQLTGGNLTSDDGKAQWRRFAAQVGAARGAWLARTFPAGSPRPAVINEGLTGGRVAGLPDTIELWLGRGGAAPVRVAALPVDQAGLGLDMIDPDGGEARWWSSFEEAKRVGLGTEKIDLGAAEPDDIDVLYAVGLGDGDPLKLFENHRDAGVLGIPALGTPTNSVAGAPAADLAQDPDTWLTLLTAPPPQPAADSISLALTGKAGSLGALPGGDRDQLPINRALVWALWSAVFGHGIKDVWGAAKHGLTTGVWALDNLVPEGPMPPLRIGDQPYGLFPVTALARWVDAPGDPDAEAGIRAIGASVRDTAATAAEAAGTITGASTERLLDLIGRVPTSRAYAWRWSLPLEVLYLLEWAIGAGIAWPVLLKWWDRVAKPVLTLAGEPARRYATLGEPQDLQLPLVQPTNLPNDQTLDDCLKRLLEVPPSRLASPAVIRELFNPLPDSLLFRLLLHARLVDAAEVARAAKKETGPFLEPVTAPSASATALQTWGAAYSDGMVRDDPAGLLFKAGREGTIQLIGADPTTLERAFRSTLDTAAHRIDPWLTGLAWRRLRAVTDAVPAPVFRLGCYGWVDAPRPRSGAAPEPEFLHAPSMEQALTAAILRDRAVSDAEPGRWQMNLDSDRVRLAEQFAAEVRLGGHLSEVLGRAVERAVGTKSAVDSLRRTFPIRTEHAGRRVCDGHAVLLRYLSAPGSLGLTAAQLEALAPLAAVLDTYGDLLVADAVHDVVSGRAELAAAAMDAAAGLAAPPSLDVLRTRRAGRSARTTVAIVLPAGTPPPVVEATTSPGLLAEPAVAALLVAETGDPAGPAWTWHVFDSDGVPLEPVTLADLGLVPIDTLSLSDDDLRRLAASIRPGAEEVIDGPGAGTARATARRISDILGSRPATPADLTVAGAAGTDAAVQAEISARYTAVHAIAVDLQSVLVAAAAGNADEQRDALIAAARWGITPLTADESTPTVQVVRAASALAERLAHGPAPADADALSVAALAQALAELVSPEGRLPVLARLAVPAALSADPALDQDWLEVAATVRPHLARLEARQLGRRLSGEAPFTAWTNRPGDPWQLDAGPAEAHGLFAETQLLAVFGPAGTLDDADPGRIVAVGLLDSYSEVVPATDHATTVAFHFDAPGARAPQAVLIAVPPDLSQPLDTATVIDILAETRALARARAAGPEELDAYAAGEPLTLLPVHQPTGVRLEPK